MTTTSRPDHRSAQATPIRPDHRPNAGRTRGPRALAVLGGVAAALAVWAVAGPLAGADLTVHTNGATRPVGPGAVAVSSLLAGLAGWALLATLERLRWRPRRAWTVIAVLVLVLSLAGPVSSGANAATTLALVGMHLAVGAVLIPALGRSVHR